MEVEKLKALKEKGKFTNKKIAELTGISEPTVSRIFSREGESKFRDVAAIAKVLGASLDDLAGIKRVESQEIAELRAKIAAQEAEIKTKDTLIASHDREVTHMEKVEDYLKRLVRVLGSAVAVLVAVILIVMVYDILNGDIGWARYAEAYQRTTSEAVLAYIEGIFK